MFSASKQCQSASFFFSSRRRHTRWPRDWSSAVCSSDLAGHVSDVDFAELRARYEGEAAAILTELDRLGPAEPEPVRSAPAAPRGSAWRHPAALAAAALLLLVFGIAVGAGIVRYTEPDQMAGRPAPGSRPLADLPREAQGAQDAPSASN